MKQLSKRAPFFILLALAFFSFHYFSLGQYATLDFLKEKQAILHDFHLENQFLSYGIFFITYTLTTALSIPVATILTLGSGVTFGFLPALILCSFASSIGAAFAFLGSRFLLYETIQEKYSHRLEKINKGVEAEGGFYLFFLRLNPIFPFFVVNLASGLTPLPLWQFYWISQVGMLPATAIYIFAATELSKISNPSDILSLNLIVAFGLVGVFPFLVKKAFQKFGKKELQE